MSYTFSKKLASHLPGVWGPEKKIHLAAPHFRWKLLVLGRKTVVFKVWPMLIKWIVQLYEPLFQIVVECNLIGSNLSPFGEDCYRAFFKHIHMWPAHCEIIIVMWRFSDVQFLCVWCDVTFLRLIRGAGYKLKVTFIQIVTTEMRSSQDVIHHHMFRRLYIYIYMFRRQGEKPNVKSKLHLPPASWEQFRMPKHTIEERNKVLPTSTMALVGFCLGTY